MWLFKKDFIHYLSIVNFGFNAKRSSPPIISSTLPTHPNTTPTMNHVLALLFLHQVVTTSVRNKLPWQLNSNSNRFNNQRKVILRYPGWTIKILILTMKVACQTRSIRSAGWRYFQHCGYMTGWSGLFSLRALYYVAGVICNTSSIPSTCSTRSDCFSLNVLWNNVQNIPISNRES